MLNVLPAEYEAGNFTSRLFHISFMDYVKESEGRECFAFFVFLYFGIKERFVFIQRRNQYK